ncbi:hypothetical protein KC318_g2463 [Hortaea werneckii]|nr:hypothetical protein KC334_g9740 [Hortaea werneckii]KAI7021224.1 hypothetical protein KC355_g2444 [Hortaea werneckii]KAI7673018.1 hypothetical protein KC318_g2463 [Hortaea werneckii]RMY28981.1 hypothetical protein D0866_09026 [Hortaea werneckii]
MADYDSDSSGAEDVATSVMLGYASKEPTGDDFSQLGGYPAWLDDKTAPSGALIKCKTCNNYMTLILQLNGEMRDRFPGHERRLYLWACRRKACRRKEGSMRGFRAVKIDRSQVNAAKESSSDVQGSTSAANDEVKPAVNLGETLFGVKSPSAAQANPFSTTNPGSAAANPFAGASTMAAKPPQNPTSTEPLAETFADKARISSPPPPSQPSQAPLSPQEPWPETSALPHPYPSYYIDADTEYLDTEPLDIPANAQLERSTAEGESSSGSITDDKAAFESSMDKTFQRFADRLAQNPEQILRYEFGGQPLLYSKTDPVGKLFAPAQNDSSNGGKVQTAKQRTNDGPSIPKCANCGAPRVFELQLTPHAITELEAEELSVEGMDWGTILFASCSADCQQAGKSGGEVGYVEEWVGVQWEEIAAAGNRR